MKTFVLLASLVSITPSIAFADYFQIFDGSRPYYIPYARVTLADKTIGYTDAYGRLKIDLPPGEYQVQIEYRSGRKTVRLFVDGGSNLKRAEAF
jgi:hypothetical protein